MSFTPKPLKPLIAFLLMSGVSISQAAVLSVKAEHDSSDGFLPTEFAVYADGAYQGTLSFGAMDDQFSVESIVIPDGTATVALNNLHDYYDPIPPYSEATDLNAYIDWIEVNGVRIEAEAYSRTSGDDGVGADEIIANYDGNGATVVNLWQTNDRVEYDLDITPPAVHSASVSPDTLWAPNHKMVDVTVTVSADDDSAAAVRCVIVGITSNEPALGTGSGATASDWEITGDLTAKLRAERSGNGSGRIYTIQVMCYDASGNATPVSLQVTVPHDQSGKPKKTK
jgi:hypothetical protein